MQVAQDMHKAARQPGFAAELVSPRVAMRYIVASFPCHYAVPISEGLSALSEHLTCCQAAFSGGKLRDVCHPLGA